LCYCVNRKFDTYEAAAFANIDAIKTKNAAITKEFVRLYGAKKTALLKELNVEEKLEIAKSRKTDIIEALIRQFELCAGSIGFLIEIRDIFSFLTNFVSTFEKIGRIWIPPVAVLGTRCSAAERFLECVRFDVVRCIFIN